MRKILPSVLLLVCLSGCGFEPWAGPVMANTAMAGANVVSYSVLGQSPVDYALSQSRQKYCDFRNIKKYGHYCVDPPAELVDPVIYCYRSLGDVECSRCLDPYQNNNRPITGGPVPSCGPTQQAAARQTLPPSSARAPLSLSPSDAELQPTRKAEVKKDSRDAVSRGDYK